MTNELSLNKLLLDNGPFDKFQIKTALNFQRKWGGDLGQIFIELKFISDTEIVDLITKFHKTPRLNRLDDRKIDAAVAKMLPTSLIRQYTCIPVEILSYGDSQKDSELIVAAFDPLHQEMRHKLEKSVDMPIMIAVAARSEILHCIRNHFFESDDDQRLDLRKQRLLTQVGTALREGLIDTNDLKALLDDKNNSQR